MTGSLTSLFAFFTSLFLVIWSERQCLSYTCQAKINRLCMSKIVPKQTKNNKLSKPKFELLRLKKGWIEFFLCLPFAKYRRRADEYVDSVLSCSLLTQRLLLLYWYWRMSGHSPPLPDWIQTSQLVGSKDDECCVLFFYYIALEILVLVSQSIKKSKLYSWYIHARIN